MHRRRSQPRRLRSPADPQFLGPNGSGKTTTIELLLDFDASTKGVIRLLGLQVPPAPSSTMSAPYIEAHFFILQSQTWPARALYSVRARPYDSRSGRSGSRTALVDFQPVPRDRAALTIAAALLEPTFFILDEPVNGLDHRVAASATSSAPSGVSVTVPAQLAHPGSGATVCPARYHRGQGRLLGLGGIELSTRSAARGWEWPTARCQPPRTPGTPSQRPDHLIVEEKQHPAKRRFLAEIWCRKLTMIRPTLETFFSAATGTPAGTASTWRVSSWSS